MLINKLCNSLIVFLTINSKYVIIKKIKLGDYMQYIIKNKYLDVTINTLGAEIKSIKYLDEERLHDSNPTYWHRSAPLLFPNIGTIKNGKTIINEHEYSLPKHGFLRDQEFTIIDYDDTKIMLEFKSNLKTKSIYPFDFQIIVLYQLEFETLKSSVTITNLHKQIMPFNFGLHPAFKIPISKDEQFNDYQIIFPTTSNYKIPTVNLSDGTIDFNSTIKNYYNLNTLDLEYFDYQNDALIFTDITFSNLTLTNKKQTKGLYFSFPNFPMLALWTPNHIKSPFICIEPWIGCADESNHNGYFDQKKYLIKLKANEVYNICYQFKFF